MAEVNFIVVSGVGPDRPGLVDSISEFLVKRKMNIVDSRMAVLGGEFAVILLAGGSSSDVQLCKNGAAQLESNTQLRINIKDTIAPDSRESGPSGRHRLTASCIDHQGVVNKITRVLVGFGINIESLESTVTPAPVSGTPIFQLNCDIQVPAESKMSEVRSGLQDVADEFNIDIHLSTAG